jgi:sugar phosphate isomerase/epimerase
MTREQIRLAHDLGCPLVRVFAQWSGVTIRDGAISYDIARYNLDHRYPGQTSLDRWDFVRDSLVEAAEMAADWGVTLVLQNHEPIIHTYRDLLDFIDEVDSPSLKACLDAPLMKRHTEAYYRQALRETGDRQLHTHYGGRFERQPDGSIVPHNPNPLAEGGCDDALFMKASHEEIGFSGHTGYELCSPVLIDHRYAGQDYAIEQVKLAAEYMQNIINELQPAPVTAD